MQRRLHQIPNAVHIQDDPIVMLQHLARYDRMRSVRVIQEGGKAGISEVYGSGKDNQQNYRGSAASFRIARTLLYRGARALRRNLNLRQQAQLLRIPARRRSTAQHSHPRAKYILRPPYPPHSQPPSPASQTPPFPITPPPPQNNTPAPPPSPP